MNPIYLAHLSWVDVERYLAIDDRLILVTGATEQHGRHLPLGTDSMIALALAERVSAATGVAIAPPLQYGMSEAHMAFPGTLTLSQDVLQGVYLDVIKSAYRHGWRRLFIINGHGGNRAALNWAVSIACKIKKDLKVYVSHWWTETSLRAAAQAAHGRNEGHAGIEETSLMLASHAEFVSLEEAVGAQVSEDIWNEPPEYVRAALPAGAVGADPGAGTAAFGDDVVALLVKEYTGLINGGWGLP